jgi:DNA-binding beta-propeller fold protein YncE
VVGYQPEEMVIVGNKLYVANSGGYRVPNYDRTVSVIDLNTFKVIKTIDVGINLHRMELDQYGNIYVSSRGDYYDTYSETFVIDSNTDKVIDELPLLPNTEMAICRDSLYVYSTEWSYYTNSWTVSYAIYNTKTKKTDTRNFITDGTEKSIKIPYGIAINPETGEFFVTDAKDYVTPGTLYCFSRDGKKKWSVITGDIPAHIAFTDKKLKEIQ